jgi:hypothetical protein
MLYDLIPNVPEARLLPLIERFTAMLADSPCLPILSAWCENEGSREGAPIIMPAVHTEVMNGRTRSARRWHRTLMRAGL